jgi:hypothetical protein
MWFQDLFNYDFRRTEMCIIPYGTQMGEISFCAFNTGVGWRQIIEKMKMNATVADWYKEHGRHPVYAKQERLELPDTPITSRLVRARDGDAGVGEGNGHSDANGHGHSNGNGHSHGHGHSNGNGHSNHHGPRAGKPRSVHLPIVT